MIIRSPTQVALLFERLGFTLESEWTSADSHGRKDILWSTLLLRYSGVGPRPIDRIESILDADRKVASYKLALIRALCDTALTGYSLVRWEPGGKMSIGLEEVTRRWIQYYWPLLESSQFIPQINGESKGAKPIAFRSRLTAVIEHYRRRDGLSAYLRDSGADVVSEEAAPLVRQAVTSIAGRS